MVYVYSTTKMMHGPINTRFRTVSAVSVILHAKRMRRIILPSAACPAATYFSTLSHKGIDFWKNKIIELDLCVSIFCIALTKIFFFRRICERCYYQCAKCLLLLPYYDETSIFSIDFRKNHKMSNFMKICFFGTPRFSMRMDRHGKDNSSF